MDDFFFFFKTEYPIYPIPSFVLVYGYKFSSEEKYKEITPEQARERLYTEL